MELHGIMDYLVFSEQISMRKCQLFCASVHHHIHYQKKQTKKKTRKTRLQSWLWTLEWVFLKGDIRSCQIFTLPGHTWMYHLKLEHCWKYRNCGWFWFELRGWKGFVNCSLGADISLSRCFGAGIGILAPIATVEPKCREASFGATLWHHVQRYCDQFLVFLLLIFLWQFNALGIFFTQSAVSKTSRS